MRAIVIRGDKKRGAEVIALLEMLGGKNCGLRNISDNAAYYITAGGIIESMFIPLPQDNYKLYTLDEFWADFPYKVGGKAHIGYRDADAEIVRAFWDVDRESVTYTCLLSDNTTTKEKAEDLLPITNEQPEPMNIAEILKDAPKGTKLFSLIHGMIELKEIVLTDTFPIKMQIGRDTVSFTAEGKYLWDMEDAECILYPSKENRDWATFKVAPKFPTSIFKCCEILNFSGYHKESEIGALRKLLIARDAWWNVDGDWKPDYAATNLKYAIGVVKGKVHGNSATRDANRVLCFRTPELRDKFLNTFRDLIERCKELI